MEDQLISLETAKLAKEKGFDLDTTYTYFEHDPSYCYNHHYEPTYWNNDDDKCAAPTQSLLQRWLREEHKILVEVTVYDDWGGWSSRLYIQDGTNPFREVKIECLGLETYEEALEKGLFQALKYIKT